MDIDALHSALVSLTVYPEQVRSVRENLTAANGAGPAALGEFLGSLERDLRITKATLARELGFTLCRCCWPPELLAMEANGQPYCPSSPKAARAPFSKPTRTAATPRGISKAREIDRFTRTQKDKLLHLRDTLVDSISGVARANLHPRANGSGAPAFAGDTADASRDGFERDFAMSLLAQEHDALAEIDQALKRIESGAYGVCEMSGKAIPRARLEAIPFARCTVECQAQREKQRKASRARQAGPPLLAVVVPTEEAHEAIQPPLKKHEPTLVQRIRAFNEKTAVGVADYQLITTPMRGR